MIVSWGLCSLLAGVGCLRWAIALEINSVSLHPELVRSHRVSQIRFKLFLDIRKVSTLVFFPISLVGHFNGFFIILIGIYEVGLAVKFVHVGVRYRLVSSNSVVMGTADQ